MDMCAGFSGGPRKDINFARRKGPSKNLVEGEFEFSF
jgi:hypothetical protein